MQELEKYYTQEYPPYLTEYKSLEESSLFRRLQYIKRKILPQKNLPNTNKPIAISTDTSHKKVLDFGCGNGQYLIQMKSLHPNWELYGFDISANKEIKKIDGTITIVTGDFEQLTTSFPKEYFDIIRLNNVFEHLNNPVSTLKDLVSLARKGCIIMIEVPNIDSLKFKVFGKYFSSLDIPRHLYHYTIKTLSEICRSCGLEIQSVRTIGSPKSTVRSLYYALGRNGGRIGALPYYIADKVTKILGEKRINTDVIVLTARK